MQIFLNVSAAREFWSLLRLDECKTLAMLLIFEPFASITLSFEKAYMRLSFSRSHQQQPSHSPVAFIYAANLNGFWFCTLWSRTALSRLALSLARLLPKSFYSATSAERVLMVPRFPRRARRRVLRFENNSIVTFANFCVSPRLRSDELLGWRAHALENLLTRAALIISMLAENALTFILKVTPHFLYWFTILRLF